MEDKGVESKPSLLRGIMKYAVPLVVTVGLCYLMFRSIDFGQMVQVIRTQCNYWWIALALVISVFSHVARAMRWRIQLQALGIDAPRSVLIYSIFGTYAVNLVFPRLGEVWRTGYVAQRQGAKFSTVFGSMVADRLADTFTVLLLTLLAFALASKHMLSYLQQNSAVYERIITVATSPWLWLGAAACVAAAWWALTRRWPEASLLGKAQKFVRGLWEGFAVIATMPGKGRWLLWTVGIWGCYFTQLYVAFFAFPFTAGVLGAYGASAALVTFVMSSIAMGVPSNGGIGPWQWAVMWALSLYGVGRTDALAFANLVLGSNTLLLILLGIFTFAAIFLSKRPRR